MDMRKALVTMIILLFAAGPAWPRASAADEAAGVLDPKIQVAILLDNSGSMSGLINQAKAQLWAFINEFALTRKNGRIPEIQVALYTYGNPPPKRIVELTNDLDLVSEKLFAVQIQGGSEYCGQVIQAATEELAWSLSPEDLKVIFIAGTEPFTQGPVPYQEACKNAIARGIVVNTIHCGWEKEGIDGQWKAGSLLADGAFLCIDQNRKAPRITAPQDAEIVRLGKDLNGTYIPYGNQGRDGMERQSAQDDNAAGISNEVLAQRAVAKANVQYRNTHWDLVDGVNEKTVKIEDLKEEDLPEAMQKMTLDERRAHVAEQARRRSEIQSKINQLNAEREKHVALEMKKLTRDGDGTLNDAMINALRSQAEKRSFQVRDGEKENPPSDPGNKDDGKNLKKELK